MLDDKELVMKKLNRPSCEKGLVLSDYIFIHLFPLKKMSRSWRTVCTESVSPCGNENW